MKALKPGQLCTIKDQVYRAKKRSWGCVGCDFDHILKCPNTNFANSHRDTFIDCLEHGIILKKV